MRLTPIQTLPRRAVRRAQRELRDAWRVLAPATVVPLVMLRGRLGDGRKREAYPRRIFQTWKSTTDIPVNMRYWSESWRAYHPEFSHELWDDALNRRFIEERFPWFLPTYDGYDREIKRADAVRYFYLYEFGGIYADMDFECLAAFTPLIEKYAAYDVILGSLQGDALGQGHTIPNALMVSKPRAPFWETVFRLLVKRSLDSSKTVEEMTGPVLLGEAWREHGRLRKLLDVRVLPPAQFYPISWLTDEGNAERLASLARDDLAALSHEMKRKYPRACAVTYWTHSW